MTEGKDLVLCLLRQPFQIQREREREREKRGRRERETDRDGETERDTQRELKCLFNCFLKSTDGKVLNHVIPVMPPLSVKIFLNLTFFE